MARRRRQANNGKIAGCVGVLFGGIFMLAGGGVFFGLTIWPVMQWQAAQAWVETPCRVVSSEVAEHDGDSTTYSINVIFEYSHEGRLYTGNRYDFVTGSSSGYAPKARVVEQYPPGGKTVCYVNPDDPTDSVINRNWSNGYLIGCFGLIFFFAGLGVMFALVRAGKREAAKGVARRVVETYSGEAASVAVAEGGPRVLESTITPKKTFISALIFTIVLYAIVGGVGYGFLSDGFDFEDGIVCFVLGIFCLVGLLGVAGTVRGFLGMWNPRVRLEMNPGALRLGGTVAFTWQLEGDTSRLESMRIYLQGKEHATYRRGTDTTTDRVVFDRITIAEAATQADVGAGRVEFAMPEFTMHTLDLPNNKIEWTIRVEGSIPKWPDIEEEFPVVVLPLPLPGAVAPMEAGHA